MYKVASRNESDTAQFTILCFPDLPHLQFPLFMTFLTIYLFVIFGNTAVLVTIVFDPHLHTPMYIFLSNLSVLDIFYTSNILPNLVIMLSTQQKIMSLVSCITQMHFFLYFGCMEMNLLAVMAYDRYVAVCHPLHYTILIRPRTCLVAAVFTWLSSLLESISFPVLVSKLSFCSSNQIDHFFCDISPLLKLSCTDTTNVNNTIYVLGSLFGMTTFIVTLVSYIYIIFNIMKIHSAVGRSKTFSTCGSHLTSVLLYYGSIMSVYMRPTSMYSIRQDKFLSLLHIVLIPLLNPAIYSLKNKQFKDAFKKLINAIFSPKNK